MIVKGEVKCYFCGFVSGEIVGELKEGTARSEFKPVAVCATQPRRDGRLRCCRCGGPVYLEDITTLRESRTEQEPAARAGGEGPLRERSVEG